MPYSFTQDACQTIAAAEYLRHFPRRGRTIRLPHLGYEVYGISDCLCLGEKTQAVAPLHNDSLPLAFSDAVPYLANEVRLPETIGEALAHGPEFQDIDEAVPLYPPGVRNFWHFTFEALSKLLALESIGYSGPYIVPAAALADQSSDILQSLALFGVSQNRLLPSGPAYRIRRLMLPQRINGFNLADNMKFTGFLRDKLLEAVGSEPGSRSVYIRRIGRRKIVNEDELLVVLRDYNFETVTPEELSVAEQWRAMTNVSCSVMAHGANTAVTLLQKPCSGFMEFFSNSYVNYTGMHAVRLLRLRYMPLVEEMELSSYPGDRTALEDFLARGIDADIHVSPLQVRIFLESFFTQTEVQP